MKEYNGSMRPGRLALQWKLLFALAASASMAMLVTGALASTSQPSAVTFTLVSDPACVKGKTTRVGHACVDRPEIPEWTVDDGSAQWNHKAADQALWQTAYGWEVPDVVPSGGASLTLTLKAVEQIGGPNNRICPAIIVSGGFAFEGGAREVALGICAQAGKTERRSKTVKLVPPSAGPGSPLSLTVRVQDGPIYTYFYEEDPCGGSRTPKRHAAANEIRVVSIVPEVQYHKENGPPNLWCPLDRNVVLHQGDEIQCDPDGSVVLAFADNQTTTVRNTTQLRIASFFTEGGVVRTEILLKMGEVAATVNKSEATKSDFRIKAPSTGGIRGTTFSVFRDPVGRAEVWSVRKGVVEITPIGGRAKVKLRAGQEVEITPQAVSKIAPIGKAGARGGVNRVKARSAVFKIIGRFNDPCGLTTPRARAFSVNPLGAGWLVSVRVVGKLRGWSKWQVSGARVAPKNALAKKIARGCL